MSETNEGQSPAASEEPKVNEQQVEGSETAAIGQETQADTNTIAADGVVPPAGKEQKTPWYKTKIDRQAETIRRQREELAAAKAPKSAGEIAAPAIDEAQLRANWEWEQKCNGVKQAGLQAFGQEFDQTVRTLSQIVDVNDSQGAQTYTNFLQVVLDSDTPGQAASLLHQIAQDPDLAHSMMEMSPAKLARELVKLETKLAEAAPKGTKAPPPVTPLQTKGSGPDSIRASDKTQSGKLSTAEWMKRREAEVTASNAARDPRAGR